jgi:hypothetical protein
MSNMRLDVAFLGRETGRDPIMLKSARRIGHDARWRGVKDRAAFAGACLAIAGGFLVLVALWACV